MTETLLDVLGGWLDGVMAAQWATLDAELAADGMDDENRAALLAWARAEYLVWKFDVLDQLRATLAAVESRCH